MAKKAREAIRVGRTSIALTLALCGACGGAASYGLDETNTDPAPTLPTVDASTVSEPPSPADDAGVGGDAGADDGSIVDAGSRCVVTPTSVSCDHRVSKLSNGLDVRDVYWQTPTTPAPPGGYPVVVVYQGSFGGPRLTWDEMDKSTPFGGYQQGRLQAMLLDHGFVVIAPEAAGGVAWQTNSGVLYGLTSDRVIILALLQAIQGGAYGPANLSRLYATGISSGGYMTSRMAVSHAGVFRALAIQSGSYATCAGVACYVPGTMPADHPPTLFLHGQADLTVPLWTARAYHEALVDDGIESSLHVDPSAGHVWLDDSPERITTWFETH